MGTDKIADDEIGFVPALAARINFA